MVPNINEVKQSDYALNLRSTQEMLLNAWVNQEICFSDFVPNSTGGFELQPSTESPSLPRPPESHRFPSVPLRPPCRGPKCAAHESRGRALRGHGEFRQPQGTQSKEKP